MQDSGSGFFARAAVPLRGRQALGLFFTGARELTSARCVCTGRGLAWERVGNSAFSLPTSEINSLV